jgi:hypothetical protein
VNRKQMVVGRDYASVRPSDARSYRYGDRVRLVDLGPFALGTHDLDLEVDGSRLDLSRHHYSHRPGRKAGGQLVAVRRVSSDGSLGGVVFVAALRIRAEWDEWCRQADAHVQHTAEANAARIARVTAVNRRIRALVPDSGSVTTGSSGYYVELPLGMLESLLELLERNA